jgi:hypothetical protein
VARSYESLWLWLGAGFIAVGAALLGVAGGLDAASKVPYSFWTSVPVVVAYAMFGLSLACFSCAIREVPIPYSISRRSAEPLVAAAAAPLSGGPGLSAAPVRVRLVAERDMAADGFRLVALNRGELGRFRAEVIGIRDQDGQAPVTPVGGWPVPWLDDGSVTAKDIPATGSPRLDFAHFSLGNLREDVEGTKWLNGDHWTFPSLPGAVTVRYPAVRTWQEQDRHFFIVTVRVIRDDPAGHAGGQPAVPVDGVRVVAGPLGPPAAHRLEERACPGPHELAGVPQRAARDPHLDGRVHQLRPRAKLLRRCENLLVGNDQRRVCRHILEGGRAADRGALAHHVPVVLDLHAIGVTLDERQHQAAVVVERADPEPVGGDRPGAVVLAPGQHRPGPLPAQPGLQVLGVLAASFGARAAEPGPVKDQGKQAPALGVGSVYRQDVDEQVVPLENLRDRRVYGRDRAYYLRERSPAGRDRHARAAP